MGGVVRGQGLVDEQIAALRHAARRIARGIEGDEIVLPTGEAPVAGGDLAPTGPPGLGDQERAVVEAEIGPAVVAWNAGPGVGRRDLCVGVGWG